MCKADKVDMIKCLTDNRRSIIFVYWLYNDCWKFTVNISPSLVGFCKVRIFMSQDTRFFGDGGAKVLDKFVHAMKLRLTLQQVDSRLI